MVWLINGRKIGVVGKKKIVQKIIHIILNQDILLVGKMKNITPLNIEKNAELVTPPVTIENVINVFIQIVNDMVTVYIN